MGRYLGFFGITFNAGFSAAQIDVLSGLISAVVVDGTYNAAMLDLNNFPVQRPNCAGYQLADANADGVVDTGFEADALALSQFAGIFLLLAFGLAASVIVKLLLVNAHHGVRAATRCANNTCFDGRLVGAAKGGGGEGAAPAGADAEGAAAADVGAAALPLTGEVAALLAEYRAATAAAHAALDGELQRLLASHGAAGAASRAATLLSRAEAGAVR